MSFRLFLARHPSRRKAKHPLIIEDFLEVAQASKRKCLRKMIEMISDLYQNGMDSGFIKHLGGPLYELKSRTSEGGARVYFLRYDDTAFIVGRAECKKESEADQNLLSSMIDVLEAFEQPGVLSGKGLT